MRGAGAAIGRVIGPSFARGEVADVVATLVETYLDLRDSDAERFIDVVERVGIDPFKTRVYAERQQAKAALAEAAHV